MRASRPVLAALLGAAGLAAAGAGAAERAAPPMLSEGYRFEEQGGAALWANVCAGCHQADARGAEGAGAYPALAGDGALASADFVARVLFEGLRGMPALGRMMSDEQAADVINYARSHFGNLYDDPVSTADAAAARARAAEPPR